MAGNYSNEPMLELYIFETTQLIEQLEHCILAFEKTNSYSEEIINEIFRIMHTIKGSSSMMLFNGIATLAHSIEDLFYFIRENIPKEMNNSVLSDLVLDGVDFLKVEIQKIKSGDEPDGDPSELIQNIKEYLKELKEFNPITKSETAITETKQQYYIAPSKAKNDFGSNTYKAIIFFQNDCDMENLRAYSLISNLQEITEDFYYIPKDLMEDDNSSLLIKENGFTVFLKTDKNFEEMHEFFQQTIYLKDLQFAQIQDEEYNSSLKLKADDNQEAKLSKSRDENEVQGTSLQQSIINVSVAKLDNLMDLVGEMVIAEAMVSQNPDLKGLELENFRKSARQLRKITSELQDMVMSIRMVPLSVTFHKMHRIVRDMSKKLNKEVELKLIGEETEVDKNIIEHISDPLMHLIRNAIDHGLESAEERIEVGKPKAGTITLEAKNSGSDVLVIVKDDGKGLSKRKILDKALENGLLNRNESDMSDREIFNLIFLPGFSTKENVTEFSGRGVGMDVVLKNIQSVGGSASVDSGEGKGTTITLKIPITLAIIDGMNIRVGNSRYTIPTMTIKESFRPKYSDIITDPDGNEIIMVRGECYPIIRLHKIYKVKTERTDFTEGILIMVEDEDRLLCIFADELLGEQQVVVKALPYYLQSIQKVNGLAGCTLLGDGSISLILDIPYLIKHKEEY